MSGVCRADNILADLSRKSKEICDLEYTLYYISCDHKMELEMIVQYKGA